MKKLSAFLILVLLLSLSSCNLSRYIISDEESNDYIEKYLAAVEEGEIETALNLFHDKVIDSQSKSMDEQIDEHIDWLLNVQLKSNVNFDDGIKIVKYRSASHALYDITKGGGYKKVDLDIQVGDNVDDTIWVTFEFLKNDDDFGLYDVIM